MLRQFFLGLSLCNSNKPIDYFGTFCHHLPSRPSKKRDLHYIFLQFTERGDVIWSTTWINNQNHSSSIHILVSQLHLRLTQSRYRSRMVHLSADFYTIPSSLSLSLYPRWMPFSEITYLSISHFILILQMHILVSRLNYRHHNVPRHSSQPFLAESGFFSLCSK